MNEENNYQAVVFGEVLFDCFPDGASVLGGAPFNVAWHLQAFGLAPLMISSVGEDELGARVREAMQGWHMDDSGVQTDSAHPTGRVEVGFVEGEPNYTIVEQRAYDHVDQSRLPAIESAAMLYHGTLALRSHHSRKALQDLRNRLGAMVFMDVNLRDPWWQRAKVLALADAADWVKLNRDELILLGDIGVADDRERALRFLQRHALDGLVVTLGEAGAFACTAAGEFAEVAPVASVDVVDTVGAGDAFSSVLILGLSRGWPLLTTLERAQTFASQVVSQRGATISELGLYRDMLQHWN